MIIRSSEQFCVLACIYIYIYIYVFQHKHKSHGHSQIDNDSDNEKLTEGQHTSVRQPGPTDISDGVITPRKKNLPCARGEMCKWDTV